MRKAYFYDRFLNKDPETLNPTPDRVEVRIAPIFPNMTGVRKVRVSASVSLQARPPHLGPPLQETLGLGLSTALAPGIRRDNRILGQLLLLGFKAVRGVSWWDSRPSALTIAQQYSHFIVPSATAECRL